MTFGTSLETIVLRMAIDSISDTSTNYRAYEFLSKRKEISTQMLENLNVKLQNYAYVELVFF